MANKDSIDTSLEECIRKLAIAVQKEILNPPSGMTNVGEWSKKEACWENINQLAVNFPEQMKQWTVSKEEFKKTKAEGRKLGKQDDGISLQKKVLDLTSNGYWLALLKWPKAISLLSPAERNLVIKASTVQGFLKVNLERDWRKLLDIQQQCEDEGFRALQGEVHNIAE